MITLESNVITLTQKYTKSTCTFPVEQNSMLAAIPFFRELYFTFLACHHNSKNFVKLSCIMEPPDPDEITTAAAVASFVAQCNPRMANALGGSANLEAAISGIGIFDDDSDFNHCTDEQGEDEEALVAVLPPVAKKRRVFARRHKSGSFWWRRYLCAEMRAAMTAEPEGRVATRFRRNFRVPLSLFDTQLLTMTVQRWWPTWTTDKVDACGRPVSDVQLKLLGCLFVLGTGSSQFQVSELTDISEEVHRCFFLSWLSKMASIKHEFIYFPVDDKSYRFVVDEYASLGLPGCVG